MIDLKNYLPEGTRVIAKGDYSLSVKIWYEETEDQTFPS